MSSSIVTRVRVVCQDHDPALNHWSIFLLLKDGQTSIQLDTVPAPGERGKRVLSVKTREYRLPRSALRHWDFHVGPSKSSSTRYTVINSFCKKTLIGRDAPRKVWTKVQNLYSSDGSRKRRDIARGQFPDEGHLSGRLFLAKGEVSDEDSDHAVFSDTADD
ncbi:hypothetical protein TWF106_002043 [Orbilia oligospora]|uniref:DUF7770 domain-containing protein n=1 Tax=Orbilia oligospora TaxID=2813651 RepID=A0A6G1M8B8_ORBOL|nr:hypothetical protein TWF788_001461 [Orbilia oligospora]KAF3203226.1 hypothetical protein TWF106_002043 [Orbilia oligospora]KAF3219524.1 hypothetical protein TWF679_010991 [Orbilia oligospora]KAF3224572.1 hypothetical protein TWF191_006038 [Orbilia oligospora]KAF3248331.1 hypothetical protein TWF192_006326 [Orbilia oligospora]